MTAPTAPTAAGCAAPDQSAPLPASLDLEKETVITGQVADRVRGGEPVAGAYVRLLDSTGEFTAEVVTSPAGQFRFFAAPGTLDPAGAVPARQRRHRRTANRGINEVSVTVGLGRAPNFYRRDPRSRSARGLVTTGGTGPETSPARRRHEVQPPGDRPAGRSGDAHRAAGHRRPDAAVPSSPPPETVAEHRLRQERQRPADRAGQQPRRRQVVGGDESGVRRTARARSRRSPVHHAGPEPGLPVAQRALIARSPHGYGPVRRAARSARRRPGAGSRPPRPGPARCGTRPNPCRRTWVGQSGRYATAR